MIHTWRDNDAISQTKTIVHDIPRPSYEVDPAAGISCRLRLNHLITQADITE